VLDLLTPFSRKGSDRRCPRQTSRFQIGVLLGESPSAALRHRSRCRSRLRGLVVVVVGAVVAVAAAAAAAVAAAVVAAVAVVVVVGLELGSRLGSLELEGPVAVAVEPQLCLKTLRRLSFYRTELTRTCPQSARNFLSEP
jgi:lysylphosphatidylglycerol synthetase-like protein (DUF2156 family)